MTSNSDSVLRVAKAINGPAEVFNELSEAQGGLRPTEVFAFNEIKESAHLLARDYKALLAELDKVNDDE